MQHTHERRVFVCIMLLQTDKVRRDLVSSSEEREHRERDVEHTLPEESTAGLRMQQKINAGDILAVNGYLQQCVEPFVVHLCVDLAGEKVTLSHTPKIRNV